MGDASNGDAFLLTPLEPGDANGDGKVDINDLTIVLANFSQTRHDLDRRASSPATRHRGHQRPDDRAGNYGYGVTAAAGVKAVPEPASLVLLLAALACLVGPVCRTGLRSRSWDKTGCVLFARSCGLAEPLPLRRPRAGGRND